jgi:hypothetical protein
VLDGLVHVCPCILHQVTAKNMDVTRINLFHKMWCNIQKNGHMMATLVYACGWDFQSSLKKLCIERKESLFLLVGSANLILQILIDDFF